MSFSSSSSLHERPDEKQANCLYEDTFEACTEGPSIPCPPRGTGGTDRIACAEILTLDVDHDRHLKYIVRIRFAIHGEAQWTDVSHPLRILSKLIISGHMTLVIYS